MTAVLDPPGLTPGPAPHQRLRALRPHRLAVPAWWRDAVGVATWASMLVVVALWVAGGGIQALGGVGEGLSSLGRLAGLVSADLLLIQVLLMARIPIVERAYGQDELARRHRWVGFASVSLMLVHMVLLILGYAITDQVNVLRQTWDFVVDYPGMLLATAATGLLLLVAGTSIRRACTCTPTWG